MQRDPLPLVLCGAYKGDAGGMTFLHDCFFAERLSQLVAALPLLWTDSGRRGWGARAP